MCIFFFDENALGVARRLLHDGLNANICMPGCVDHALVVPRGALDVPIFQALTQIDRVVLITKDKKMQSRPIEVEKFQELGIRSFTISVRKQTVDVEARLLTRYWGAIESMERNNLTGPWNCRITQHGLRHKAWS